MSVAEAAFAKGDLVQLIGGVTPLIVVSVRGTTAFCSPLPFQAGDPVVGMPTDQLRHLLEMPPGGPESWANMDSWNKAVS